MNVEIAGFGSEHAALVEDLARRAFAGVRSDAQPDQRSEFIAHLLGPSNPAGRSRIALVREGGTALGSMVAIPAHFRRTGGQVVTGHQIGYFFVDRSTQGKGVGTALLAELTAAVRHDAKAFVYSFPNRRSIGRFDRFGYERIASIPTYVYPSFSRRRGAGNGRRDAAGRDWTIETVDAAAAAGVAASSLAALPHEPGFVRDARRFAWRYCGPGADARYRFAVGRAGGGTETFLAVCARHRMLGVRFSVLVDVLSPEVARHYGAAVRAAARVGGAPFVYCNSNLGRLPRARAERLPRGLRVPRLANPRPIELVKLPGAGGVSGAELAASLVMTADWLGF